jgi:hypothetical protein
MSEEGDRPLSYDEEPEDEGARTTVRPPFDPEQFARESDSMIGLDGEPPSERPTAPPPPGLPQYTGGPSLPKPYSLTSVGSEAVPSLAIAREDLEWFELPRLTRDLLALVDGRSTLAVICARGGLALEAAMAACHELDCQGIVTLRRGPSTGG